MVRASVERRAPTLTDAGARVPTGPWPFHTNRFECRRYIGAASTSAPQRNAVRFISAPQAPQYGCGPRSVKVARIIDRVISAILFDIDGTLVDSNDAHAHAWVKAFAESGISVSFDDVRWKIGMGGDKLMPAVSGIEDDTREGKRISERRSEIFTREYLPHLQPFPGASELVAACKRRGFTVVAASSAQKGELRKLLEIANTLSLLDDYTSSDDADESKPAPDIIEAALKQAKATASRALMIGDTPYDIEAAQRAGVAAIAFRCGGWSDKDLTGTRAIYNGPWDLLAHIDELALTRRAV
jgi:HAD superfamily hydrolase (TIGR01509 family)